MALDGNIVKLSACEPPPGLESPRFSERSTDLGSWASCEDDEADTMMVKNLPVRCKVEEISAALKDLGFIDGDLVFVNLPSRKGMRNNVNRGYCFIKFRSVALAQHFRSVAEGYHLKSRKSAKGMCVEPAKYQGSELASLGETLWLDKACQIAEFTKSNSAIAEAFDHSYVDIGEHNLRFEPAFVHVCDSNFRQAGKIADATAAMSPAHVMRVPYTFAGLNMLDISPSFLRLRL